MNTWNPWMLAGAVLVALFFLYKLIFVNGGKMMRVSYQRRDFLFTPEERACLNILDEAMGQTHRIFGKIPVVDLLTSRNLDKDADARKMFEDMQQRRFSFVVCDKDNLTVVCALQVESLPRDRPNGRGGDPLMALCEGAGLPFIRVSPQALPNAVSLREQIQSSVRRDPMFAESDGRREPRFSNFDDLDL